MDTRTMIFFCMQVFRSPLKAAGGWRVSPDPHAGPSYCIPLRYTTLRLDQT